MRELGPNEEAKWEFYDTFRAFPRNSRLKETNVVQEMNVGLNCVVDGRSEGTFGEFNIRWHDLAKGRPPYARVEAFDDSWDVIVEGRIMEILASLGDSPTYDVIATALIETLGARDRTAELIAATDPPRETGHDFIVTVISDGEGMVVLKNAEGTTAAMPESLFTQVFSVAGMRWVLPESDRGYLTYD